MNMYTRLIIAIMTVSLYSGSAIYTMDDEFEKEFSSALKVDSANEVENFIKNGADINKEVKGWDRGHGFTTHTPLQWVMLGALDDNHRAVSPKLDVLFNHGVRITGNDLYLATTRVRHAYYHQWIVRDLFKSAYCDIEPKEIGKALEYLEDDLRKEKNEQYYNSKRLRQCQDNVNYLKDMIRIYIKKPFIEYKIKENRTKKKVEKIKTDIISALQGTHKNCSLPLTNLKAKNIVFNVLNNMELDQLPESVRNNTKMRLEKIMGQEDCTIKTEMIDAIFSNTSWTDAGDCITQVQPN